MSYARYIRLLGWLLIVAFLLPVPVVTQAENAAWKVVWAHPVLSLLRDGLQFGPLMLYLTPLALGIVLLTAAWSRPWLAAVLSIPPWLLPIFASRTGQSLLISLQQHSFVWAAIGFCLLWVGALSVQQERMKPLVRYASLAGSLLAVAWIFVPGFNRLTPNIPLVRLPFTLFRSGIPDERLLGMGLLFMMVCWLIAVGQTALEWLRIKLFSRKDRRQTLLLSMVFFAAGAFFATLVSVVLQSNEAAQAQGWVLVGLSFSKLKAALTLVPLFVLTPISWSAWITSGNERNFI